MKSRGGGHVPTSPSWDLNLHRDASQHATDFNRDSAERVERGAGCVPVVRSLRYG